MTFFLDVAGSGRKFHWHSESGTRLRWTKQGWHIDSSEGRSRVLVFIVLQRHCFQVSCPRCTTKMQRGRRPRQVCPQLVRVIWVAHISFAAAGWMYWKEAEGRYRHAIISIAEAYIYSACVNHLTYIYNVRGARCRTSRSRTHRSRPSAASGLDAEFEKPHTHTQT